MQIVFATNNEHKLNEISDLLGGSFTLFNLRDVKINEDIPEDLPTLEGNALFKAKYVHNMTGMNVFADDTGLEIEELNGSPGVHSARFAGRKKIFMPILKRFLSLWRIKRTEKQNSEL